MGLYQNEGDKMKNQKWAAMLPHGYYIVETRSIGHKWVYYKTTGSSRYTRMKRSAWDKACLRSLEEQQYRIDIKNAFKDMGGDFTKPARINKSHPTRKFGWEYKTFEEVEAEVLAKKKASNLRYAA